MDHLPLFLLDLEGRDGGGVGVVFNHVHGLDSQWIFERFEEGFPLIVENAVGSSLVKS